MVSRSQGSKLADDVIRDLLLDLLLQNKTKLNNVIMELKTLENYIKEWKRELERYNIPVNAVLVDFERCFSYLKNIYNFIDECLCKIGGDVGEG